MITFFMTLTAHVFGKRAVEEHIWIIAMMLGFVELMITALVVGEMFK